MREAALKGTTRDVIYRGYASGTSMRSFIEASDVAALALFLASDGARLISGQMVAVDGHTENPDPKIYICRRRAPGFRQRCYPVTAKSVHSPGSRMFGLQPAALMARYDRMGLIWMLNGERVVSLLATGRGCQAG